MAVSRRDKLLLSAFPRPPSEIRITSPTGTTIPSPRPSPLYRASDFGFIQVGLDTKDDDTSIYGNDVNRVHSVASVVPISVPIPTSEVGDLQLVLDNPSKLYSPLDAITGYISGWDPSSHIHLVLQGCCKTCFRTEHVEHNDRAPLVYQVTHLKPEDQQVVPRFSVMIPDTTQSGLERLDDFALNDRLYGPYWTHDWPAQDTYQCQAGHPLPPSMITPLKAAYNLTSRISGRGYIEYKLIAIRSRLDAVTEKLVPEASCQFPIWLTTRRLPISKVQSLLAQTSTTTERLEVRTHHLAQERRPSLSDCFRDTFSSSTPSFYFAPKVSTPKISTPSAEIHISISVSILPPPAGKLYNFPVPDISISSFKCRIRSYTGLRILRPSLANPDKPAQPKSYTFKACELRQSKIPLNAVFRPKDGNYDNQSCRITITLPKTILPSFKTYNFWRSYRLECDVTFRAAEKEVTAYTQSDLNIVARPEAELVNKEVRKVGMEREDESSSLKMAQTMIGMAGLGLDGLEVFSAPRT